MDGQPGDQDLVFKKGQRMGGSQQIVDTQQITNYSSISGHGMSQTINPDGYPYYSQDQINNRSAMDQQIIDMEVGVEQRKPFSREDFRFMISKTYMEYYGKFKD